MYIMYIILTFYYLCEKCNGLICFNCSATHRDAPGCAGDFAKPSFSFNSTRNMLINCTGDNMMCFVRSWNARAKHAWIVQRGCYQTDKNDLFPRTMTIPTRAMACKIERLPEAEYKVCFCQANWCNKSPSNNYYTKFLVASIVFYYVMTITICSSTHISLIQNLIT